MVKSSLWTTFECKRSSLLIHVVHAKKRGKTTIFSFIVILHRIFGLCFTRYLVFCGACLDDRHRNLLEGWFWGLSKCGHLECYPSLSYVVQLEGNVILGLLKGMESLLLQQKSFFIRSPYDWLKSIGVINGSFFQSSCFFVNFTSLLRAHTEPRGVENFDRILTEIQTIYFEVK